MVDEVTRPIGFVAARYGDNVLGGAEAVLRDMAVGLHARGLAVEVLTTTAVDLYRPANILPAGRRVEDGIVVRRFGVEVPQRGPDRIGHRILGGELVPVLDQMEWMNTGMRSPDFFEYLVQHAGNYHALVCGPYMSWTSFASAEVAADRTIIMPCLHDEPFARLELFRPEMEEVRGVWFLSDPERDLAASIFQLPAQNTVIGSGITVPRRIDAEGFRRRHRLTDDFLLYAGRREHMKGWDEMVSQLAVTAQLLRRTLILVTCGAGPVGPAPDGVRIVDLGFVSEAERWEAFAAATAYLQPSTNESFSRSVLEAWAAGTVVIANAGSAVVSWHCQRSRGGLTYRDTYEFAAAVRLALDAPELRANLSRSGSEYVRTTYGWAGVLDRMEASLRTWQ